MSVLAFLTLFMLCHIRIAIPQPSLFLPLQVIKAERATVAESLDGGVADASTGRNQDTRLQWQGMVKGSAFQQAVHAHNEKL